MTIHEVDRRYYARAFVKTIHRGAYDARVNRQFAEALVYGRHGHTAVAFPRRTKP